MRRPPHWLLSATAIDPTERPQLLSIGPRPTTTPEEMMDFVCVPRNSQSIDRAAANDQADPDRGTSVGRGFILDVDADRPRPAHGLPSFAS